jgi:hypothetical protein
MFKIGEKIVFVGSNTEPKFNGFNFPIKGEIVTVYSYCLFHKGNLDISEYLKDNNGRYQSFNPINFRKLDNNWVKELLERIIEEVEECVLV